MKISSHFSLSLLILSIIYSSLIKNYKNTLVSIAEYYATEQFGDSEPPLESCEREEWFRYMGLRSSKIENPTIPYILKYIQERESLSSGYCSN